MGARAEKRIHKALRLLRRIPRGKVVSYKELARVCKTSPRAVGSIMKHNPCPEEYPCYKVVSQSGDVGGYTGEGGVRGKIERLRREGVEVSRGKIDKRYFYRFKGPKG